MYATKRIINLSKIIKRHSSLYSVDNVINEENLRKCAIKFSNMKEIRLQTHEPSKRAAVLIPLCVVNNKASILYTLRASHLKSHRGQVSFPGGMQDLNDEDLLQTAVRETEEELGLAEKHIKIWGSGKLIVTRGETCVLPVIGQIKGKLDLSTLTINPEEVSEVFTVTLEDLCDSKKIGHTQFRNTYSAPLFLGGSQRIWGLTALITSAFLRSLLPTSAYKHQIPYISSIKPVLRYSSKT